MKNVINLDNRDVFHQTMTAKSLEQRVDAIQFELEKLDNAALKIKLRMNNEPLPPPECLTPQQVKVLNCFANCDLGINEVGDKLCISSVTAHQHITAARRALGAKNNQAMIKRGIMEGWLVYK